MSYLITRTASPRRVRARLAGIGVATQEKKSGATEVTFRRSTAAEKIGRAKAKRRT